MKKVDRKCSGNHSKKLGRRETFPDIVHRMPKHELRLLMTKTQVAAAKIIGISPTTLKKLCRHYGIPRWPFRQIAGIDRAVDRLDAMLAEPSVPKPTGPSTSTAVTNRLSLSSCRDDGNGGRKKTMPRDESARKPVRRGRKTNSSDPVGIMHHLMDSAGGADGVEHTNTTQPPSAAPYPHQLTSSSGDNTLSNFSCGYTGYDDPFAIGCTNVATRTLATAPLPEVTAINGGGIHNQNSYLAHAAMAMAATAATSTGDISRSSSGSGSSRGSNDYDNDIDRNFILSSIAAVAGVAAAAATTDTPPPPPPPPPSSWQPSSNRRSWIYPSTIDFPFARTTPNPPDGTTTKASWMAAPPPAPFMGFDSDRHSSLELFQPGPAPSQATAAAAAAPRVTCEEYPLTPAVHAPKQTCGGGVFGAIGDCSDATAATAGAPVVPAATTAATTATATTATTTTILQRGAAEGETALLAEPAGGQTNAARFKELCALEQLLFGDNSVPPAASAAVPGASSFSSSSLPSSSPSAPSGATACSDDAKSKTTVYNIQETGGGVVGETIPAAAAAAAAAASCRWGTKTPPTGMVLSGGGGGDGGGSLFSSPVRIGSDPWSVEPEDLPSTTSV